MFQYLQVLIKYKRQQIQKIIIMKSQSQQAIDLDLLWQDNYSKNDEEYSLNVMAQNLQHLHQQMHHHQSTRQSGSIKRGHILKEINVQYDKQKIVTSLRKQYRDYLSKRQLPSNHQDKILYLLDQHLTPTTALAIFQMLYYFKEALHPDLLKQLSSKILIQIDRTSSPLTIQQKVCYYQLLSICTCQNELFCQHLTQSLLQQTIDLELAVYALTNQGITGLAYLTDLASRDIFHLSNQILDYLSRTQSIVLDILVQQLLKDVEQPGISKARELALAALNRLAPLLSPKISGINQHNHKNIITQLTNLLHDPSLDKKLLLSTLRSAGSHGEQTLLDIISSRQLTQHSLALALSTLSWRIPSRYALRIKTIEYTLEHCYLPGRLYQYEGSTQPWNYSNRHCTDTLCVSSKDLLSHLQIYLRQKSYKNTHKTMNNQHLSLLVQVLELQEDQEEQDEESKIAVSQDVVRTLVSELKNKSVKIREIALLELGNIGCPEASIALQSVSKCLSDTDSSIRSAACWTISRIASSSSSFPKKLQQKLCQLLKDSYWKVRTSACIALGLLLNCPQYQTVQILVKTLQDGSIPKPAVCQSLARVGAQQLLLQISKNTSKNNFKLRQAIISSFAFVNIHSNLLNQIVQQLLKHSKDGRVETRQLCLLTIGALKDKIKVAQNKVQDLSRINSFEKTNLLYTTQLQQKKLLPFYYVFLDDPSPKIRSLASKNLLEMGPQAQLLFIQGMTKGQPLAKIQCIRCLAELGVQNFRAVVLGLRDCDERVRRAAGDAILDHFKAEQVIEEFGGKSSSLGLACNLRQILSDQSRSDLCKTLKKILSGLHKSSLPENYSECIEKSSIFLNQNIQIN